MEVLNIGGGGYLTAGLSLLDFFKKNIQTYEPRVLRKPCKPQTISPSTLQSNWQRQSRIEAREIILALGLFLELDFLLEEILEEIPANGPPMGTECYISRGVLNRKLCRDIE